MNFIVASVLVLIAMVDAHPQRLRPFARQQSVEAAPYAGQGWRPQGAEFNLPRQTYGAPPQTYGPPPTTTAEPEPVTTTELPTTTEVDTEAPVTDEPKIERVIARASKLQQSDASPVYLIVPQRQNYAYTFQQQSSAPLVAYPQSAELTATNFQTFPSYYTPYTSYVQIYQ